MTVNVRLLSGSFTGPGRPRENRPNAGPIFQTRKAAAKEANIDRHLMQRSIQIASLPETKFEQAIAESIEKQGKVTVDALLSVARHSSNGDRKSTRLNSSHVRISYA